MKSSDREQKLPPSLINIRPIRRARLHACRSRTRSLFRRGYALVYDHYNGHHWLFADRTGAWRRTFYSRLSTLSNAVLFARRAAHGTGFSVVRLGQSGTQHPHRVSRTSGRHKSRRAHQSRRGVDKGSLRGRTRADDRCEIGCREAPSTELISARISQANDDTEILPSHCARLTSLPRAEKLTRVV